MRSRLNALLVFLSLLVAAGVPEASAQLVANGTSLTVTTTNAVATFAGADLVGLQNSLTSETYLKNPSTGQLASINSIAPGQTLQTSNWILGIEGGTGAALASITVSDSSRALTIAVKIDSATQEIVVKSAATVTTPGLRYASWSIAGLDMVGGRLIVPANTGEVFDAAHPPVGAHIQYPAIWHAQMAVYEAAQGSFILYSTDSQFRFKDLYISTRGDVTADVAVTTEAIAPFPTATSVPAIEWRMKAFSGDWRIAAQVYKTWLNANRPVVSNSAHPWVQNIRTVVGIRALDETVLAPLAAKLVPSQTLLYVHDWRQDPYDTNYPDYTPRSGVASFMTAAHALGFKVMLHFDLIGVSPGNADYAGVQAFQAKTSETLQPTGWLWDQPSLPYRFAIIDPASSAFRALFVSRVGAAINAVHPDALHLDFSGSMSNDGNGPIEGLTYPQGSAQLQQDLIAAFPTVALGGEGENDVLYRYHSFAQSWNDPDSLVPGHPIVDFLFSPQVQYYGHLAQPRATDPSFWKFLSDLEHRAITPSLAVWSVNELDTAIPDNARLIGLLESWQDHAFQPDWSSSWAGALVRYTGAGSTTAAFTDTGTLETLTGAGSTLYQTARNANEVVTTSFIPNWLAFDDNKLYGLDSSQRYFLDPLPRPTTTHITSLPAGDKLGDTTLVTPKFAHIQVLHHDLPSFDFYGNAFVVTTGILYQGSDWPIANGAEAFATTASVGGVSRQALLIRPPWQAQFGGETFMQYYVPVSSSGKLKFSVGIRDGATCNVDGVTFRVIANGTELYRQTFPLGAWHDGAADLSAYANSTVALRLISNPGPQNSTACDPGLWSQFNIEYPPVDLKISVPVALASGSTFSGFTGDGSFSLATPLTGTVSNMSDPSSFTIFTQSGSTVTGGANLASLPFEVHSAQHGEMATPGTVNLAGTIGSPVAGGVMKTLGIWAHPPSGGQSLLSWTLRLPDTGTYRLGWSAGILDGALSDDGVDFSVLINGIPYWQLTKQTVSWTDGAIELQQWKGQTLLLQLITDSRSNYNYDWADWADLIVSTSNVTCSFGIPAEVTVAAQGGQLSLNIAAPSTCPWSVTSTAPWLSVLSGGPGMGTGTVNYTVAQNLSGPRSGTLIIAGQTFRIKQADANGNLP